MGSGEGRIRNISESYVFRIRNFTMATLLVGSGDRFVPEIWHPRDRSLAEVRQLRRDRSCSPTRYVTRATLRVCCDMGLLAFCEEYYIFNIV